VLAATVPVAGGEGCVRVPNVIAIVRVVLLLGYLGVIAAAFVAPITTRVFWTMVMPAVPLGFVLAGFHAWRRTCPIATVGALGAQLHRGGTLPAGWRRRGLTIAFIALIATLTLRLVATNGDGVALGLFLASLGLGALVVNAWGGGRSFCHHLCPVGVVERIYTDDAPSASSVVSKATSRCGRCTGCAPACADLDQERSFRRARDDDARRSVTYAFPGVVLAFYAYYALREGTWEAYFDGRWTLAPFGVERVTGPGFHFAPEVPAVFAATLTLVGFAGISHALFATIEHALLVRWPDVALRRERMLAFASFTAFNLFYLFAGAPSLRLVPGVARALELVVPVVATLVLVHRLRRSDEVPSSRELGSEGREVVGGHVAAQVVPVATRSLASDDAPHVTKRRLPVWKEAG